MGRLVATGTAALGQGGDLTRGVVAVAFVLAILGILAWLLRRGTFGPLQKRARGLMRIEATVPLGDRRALMVVAVEGRRLLLGLTPMQVSLVAELEKRDAPFDDMLARATGAPHTPS